MSESQRRAGDAGTGGMDWGRIWPCREEFLELARTRRVIPVVERLLVDDATPLGIYRRLARGAGTFILESAEHDGRWDRWSFVGVRSSAHMVARGGRASWIGQVPEGVLSEGTSTEVIASALAELTAEPLPGLPPLTGGLVGALGWDTLYDWEPTLSREAPGELTTPDAALCLVSDMVAVDHHEGVVWLMSNAVNADNRDAGAEAAYDAAVERLSAMAADLSTPVPLHAVKIGDAPTAQPVLRTPREDFERAVDEGKEAIREGEVFQVVLSQRADVECTADPFDVYRVLRTVNPSPYMYYLRLADGTGGDFSVVGSSPETLIRLTAG